MVGNLFFLNKNKRFFYLPCTSAVPLYSSLFHGIVPLDHVLTLLSGLALYTFGTGFGAFARSLSSSLTKPTQIGALYTAMSVMDTIGSLLAGPSLALAFKWGMHLGGFWLGMPFLWSTALCGMVACMIDAVRLPREQSAAEEESEHLFVVSVEDPDEAAGEEDGLARVDGGRREEPAAVLCVDGSLWLVRISQNAMARSDEARSIV